MRVEKPIELAGYFWLPNTPSDKVPGTVRVDGSGECSLEILGLFGGPVAFNHIQSDPNIQRIVGLVEGGAITLEQCFYTKPSLGFGTITKSTLHVNWVLLGVAFDDEDALLFSKIDVTVEGLDHWLNKTGVVLLPGPDLKSVNIHYSPPKELALNVSTEQEIVLCYEWRIPALNRINGIELTQEAVLSLRPKTAKPLVEFRESIRRILNFLSFAVDETLSITSVTGHSPSATTNLVDGKIYEMPIRIFYASLPQAQAKPEINIRSMLFRYEQVADDFDEILRRWFANHEQSEPAFNLYFSAKSGAHRYIESSFLALAQGIETLHRRNSTQTPLPAGQFKELVLKIVEACPEQHKPWLEGRLCYGNELSLRARLTQMIAPFKQLFGNSKKRSSLVGRIVDTRNYLTHYDGRLSNVAATGMSLYELNLKLECLFQLHLMKLIGLTPDQIDKLAKDSQALSYKLAYTAS